MPGPGSRVIACGQLPQLGLERADLRHVFQHSWLEQWHNRPAASAQRRHALQRAVLDAPLKERPHLPTDLPPSLLLGVPRRHQEETYTNAGRPTKA
jgi:hypothetical protein